ncbi:glycosyltransferase family protein [Campylobacter coli]|uniref:hypothetical protein n=2 Tax=Campylobacter coli TaxID=195 RepID=UPI0006B4ADC5|nr:hypothetical protein [Campylobacter coli]
MKKTAILLACDGNYDFMLANIIIGIKRWNDDVVDNIIVMYDNIDNLTLNKIRAIWPEKIIFKNYTYKNFIHDIGEDNLYLIENLADLKTHLIYTRYYLFELLKDYDYAVWLEPDELITGSIKKIIYNTKELCGAYWFTDRIQEYLNSSFCPIFYDKKKQIHMLGGGFIVASKTILLKTQVNKLSRECFDHLINYLKMCWNKKQTTVKWCSAPGTDEMVFGILAYKYNLMCQDITKLANTLPSVTYKSNHVHFVIRGKATNKIFNFSFQEYMVNNKIWVDKYKGVNKLNLMKTNIPIDSKSDLYCFLYNLECLSHIQLELSKIIAQYFSHYKLYYSAIHHLPFFDIYTSFYNDKLFFRIILPSCVREKMYLQIVFKDSILEHNFLNKISLILPEYKKMSENEILIYDIPMFRRPYHSLYNYKIKNTCLTNSYKFNPYDSVVKNRDIILEEIKKIFTITLRAINIEEVDSKKLNIKLNDCALISAKSRIQNHLSYKLGQAMIINSKSLLGYIRMPFVLSYIKDKHKQEQKIYQEKIKKDPSLKLPPLESYPDYKEALKEKECLTYKLGEALIRANNNWYGGGGISNCGLRLGS